MPDALSQYTGCHERMCVAVAACIAPPTTPEEQYYSLDFSVGDLAAPTPPAIDPTLPFNERIAKAFELGLQDAGAFAARDKLRATITSAQVVPFIAGIGVGLPIGIKNNIVGQIEWTASLVADIVMAGADLYKWWYDPKAWATGLLYDFDPTLTDQAREQLIDDFGDTIPPWLTSAILSADLLYDTARTLVPALWDDEELREELLIEASRGLTILVTSGVVKRLDAAGADGFEQGKVLGEVVGEILGLAVITIAMGAVRLPAKIAAEAVEIGTKVASTLKAIGTDIVEGVQAVARLAEEALRRIVARIRAIVAKAFAKHPAAAVVEMAETKLLPAVATPSPTTHPVAAAVKKLRRRARLSLPKKADELMNQFAGKLVPHHVAERVKSRFNRIIEATTGSKWERLLAHLSSHHVVEANYFDDFANDFRKVTALDETGKPLTDVLGNPVKMASSDDMTAILVPGEGHYGNPSPESWTGSPITRIETSIETLPDGSTRSVTREVTYRPQDSFPQGLPTLTNLNTYLARLEKQLPGGKFRDVGEMLDWHEYWYTNNLLNPRFDPVNPVVSTPIPKPPQGIASQNLNMLRTILAEINRIRTELHLPVHPIAF